MDRPLPNAVRSLVVKLGTQVLSAADARLDVDYLREMARQVAALRAAGVLVTIVSSGAIGAGLRELDLPKRPGDLGKLQAVAAVGQRKLMDAWAEAFAPLGLRVAQILLTREDIDRWARFLNVRNTIAAVHELGAIPIVNENDTISTDELVRISFGDNDILAAALTQTLRADLLVLLSVVDGLLDERGASIRVVDSAAAARSLVRKEKSALGRGGMDSKLLAAMTVTRAGEAMVVAHGRTENVLSRILAGEAVGTLFVPSDKKRLGRDRWLATARAVGRVLLDDGAAAAITQKGRSLLAAGVKDVQGEFGRGDPIDLLHRDTPIARGLSNYTAADLRLVAGKKTAEAKAILHERAHDEVVHRNNLVLL